MYLVLAIAAGGAIGSVLRHFSGKAALVLLGTGFPYGTLFVNVLGSFVMGGLIGLFAHSLNPSAEMRAFLTIGVLGGFTTFSTFSLDAITLYERGEILSAILYIMLSLTLSLAGIAASLYLTRSFAP